MQDTSQLINQVIGGCRIDKLLGRGGMGSVYLAHHLNLDIPVALKLLSEHLSKDSALVDRFVLEARAAAKLDSPHIVRVMQVGEENGQFFIQMEFVQGESLADILKREAPVPVSRALHYLYQVSLGLASAHEANFIHRDIKPENILISYKGVLKIADFGLAKSLQSTSNLTHSGQILGTPYYLPPEQCEGKGSDGRGDIYSLGVTFYYMITGQLPFQGDSPISIAVARLQCDPPSPKILQPGLSEEIENLTLKMMARLPEKRYQTIQQLLQEVGVLLQNYNSGTTTESSMPLYPPAGHVRPSGVQDPAIATETMLAGQTAITSQTHIMDNDNTEILNAQNIHPNAATIPHMATPVPPDRTGNSTTAINNVQTVIGNTSPTMRRDFAQQRSETAQRTVSMQTPEKKNNSPAKRWAIDIAVAVFIAIVAWMNLKKQNTYALVYAPEKIEYEKILQLPIDKRNKEITKFRKLYPTSRYALLLEGLYKEAAPPKESQATSEQKAQREKQRKIEQLEREIITSIAGDMSKTVALIIEYNDVYHKKLPYLMEKFPSAKGKMENKIDNQIQSIIKLAEERKHSKATEKLKLMMLAPFPEKFKKQFEDTEEKIKEIRDSQRHMQQVQQVQTKLPVQRKGHPKIEQIQKKIEDRPRILDRFRDPEEKDNHGQEQVDTNPTPEEPNIPRAEKQKTLDKKYFYDKRVKGDYSGNGNWYLVNNNERLVGDSPGPTRAFGNSTGQIVWKLPKHPYVMNIKGFWQKPFTRRVVYCSVLEIILIRNGKAYGASLNMPRRKWRKHKYKEIKVEVIADEKVEIVANGQKAKIKPFLWILKEMKKSYPKEDLLIIRVTFAKLTIRNIVLSPK